MSLVDVTFSRDKVSDVKETIHEIERHVEESIANFFTGESGFKRASSLQVS